MNIDSVDECWLTVYSEKHKRQYYYNPKTKESTWHRPVRVTSKTPHLPAKAIKKDPAKLPAEFRPEWSVHYDLKHKRCYYYNKRTKKSTWTHPMKLQQTKYNEPKDSLPTKSPGMESPQNFSHNLDANNSIPSPTLGSNGASSNQLHKVCSWQRFFDLKGTNHNLRNVEESQSKSTTEKSARKPKLLPVGQVQKQADIPGKPLQPGPGVLPFLAEIKQGKANLQKEGPCVKATVAKGNTQRAPTLLDEIKKKISDRKAWDINGKNPTPIPHDEERKIESAGSIFEAPRSVQSENSRPKSQQMTILDALMTKSKEFQHNSEECVDMDSLEETWSLPDDAEIDSSSSYDAKTLSATFRITKDGSFQMKSKGDDWKNFEESSLPDSFDIEEKSFSGESSDITQPFEIREFGNTLKHIKTLQAYIEETHA